jgi:septal ring factor EnvC (AmiA/AmiB activator)
MSLNWPTLFPRVPEAAEKRERDEAEAAERRKRADQEQTQSSRVNRGVTAPPQFGRPRGLESGLGLFS